MLSLPSRPFRAGAEAYYLTLEDENYYTEGGEPMGQWFGQGAQHLGLGGIAEKGALAPLIQGRSPSGKNLVQNAGDEERAAGWDLTFSAPKSVSTLWALLDPDKRQVIQDCHQQAVRSTLSQLEEMSAFSRVGQGGGKLSKAKCIFALFEHHTSRANDPQLHTHCLTLNVCFREDGSSGTLYSAPLYRDKMFLGAVYRTQLAQLLEERLAVKTHLTEKSFEVEGVSQKVMSAFSRRRKDILEALEKRGLSGPVAAATAALYTRQKKQHLPREILFPLWQELGNQHGFGPKEAQALFEKAHTAIQQPRQEQDTAQQPPATRKTPVTPQRVITRLAKELAESRGHFTENELLQTTFLALRGKPKDLSQIAEAVKKEVHSKRIVQTRQTPSGQPLYTTKELYKLEQKILRYAADSRKTKLRFGSHLAYGIAVGIWEKLPFTPKLSAEQRHAVRHLTLSSGSIKLVAGAAGSGKSFMLNAARRVWELRGFKVLGAAVSGIAADNLEQSSGIRSRTIAGTLLGLKKGAIRLDRKSILVVDEAGMLSTRDLYKLVQATQGKRAKLILVGDENQIQSINAGGGFIALSERLGRTELHENRRQRAAWHRDAIKLIPKGRSSEALGLFEQEDRLHFEPTKDKLIERLVSDWKKIAARAPKSMIVLAATRDDAKSLNLSLQAEQREGKRLGVVATRIWGQNYYRGDRVLFTRNSKNLGVRNGHLGTVAGATPLGMLVRLDAGKLTIVPPLYRHIDLGYAVTTHKAQGITIENALVLAGGTMADRQLSYVQASRARGHTAIYAVGEKPADARQELAAKMARNRQKEFASEVHTHVHTRQ